MIVVYLPEIGGGSTTVDGPKNDGISLAVVTGVFRSPVWISVIWLPSADALECPCWIPEPMLGRIFKCGCELVVIVLLLVNVWWWCVWAWWCWWRWCWLLKWTAVCDDCCCWLVAVFDALIEWLLLFVNKLLLFAVNGAVVAAVFKRHVSKLSTLKWAAAADSVSKNAWCDGATRVSNPSMIMAVAGGPGALPPTNHQWRERQKKNKTNRNTKLD